MSIFYPTLLFHRISEITCETLDSLGVTALILDVDNTLATHNNPVPDKDVLLWIERMRRNGIHLVIASNNNRKRVAPFAKALSLDYAANSMKPLPIGFWRTSKQLRIPPEQIGVVGDQIFTDILGGNLFRAKTFLVEPMQPESGWFFRLKREIEIIILNNYRKKKENNR